MKDWPFRLICIGLLLLQTVTQIRIQHLETELYETREEIIKLGNAVVKFQQDNNSSLDHHSAAIESILNILKMERR
jgi:hypothetical protein